MTQLIHSSEQYRIDTTAPVCLVTDVSPTAVAGVYGHRFIMYVNEQRTDFVEDTAGVQVRSRMDRLASDPRRARALTKARSRLGQWMGDEPSMNSMGLAALRLKSGLSQAQLAEKMGTQQSNISRLENNPSDVQVSTVMKLAIALQRDAGEVFSAIAKQLEVRE